MAYAHSMGTGINKADGLRIEESVVYESASTAAFLLETGALLHIQSHLAIRPLRSYRKTRTRKRGVH